MTEAKVTNTTSRITAETFSASISAPRSSFWISIISNAY
jgi:hypothetical protein